MSLTVVTYNLSGAPIASIERIAELVKNADVVAFQEVCIKGLESKIFDAVIAAMKKRDFSFRRFDGAFSARNYIELLFVKPPVIIIDTVYIPFKRSLNNHGISVYALSVKVTPDTTRTIQIATAQIESSTASGPVTQRQQLDHLKEAGKLDSPSILLLDTNIRAWQQPPLGDIGGYNDAWRDVGSSNTEITYDSKRNTIAHESIEEASDRRDRIYVRGVECMGYCLFGVNARPELSSHYGVGVTIKLT